MNRACDGFRWSDLVDENRKMTLDRGSYPRKPEQEANFEQGKEWNAKPSTRHEGWL